MENAKYEPRGDFYEWAYLLSQQAAEKALKAVFQKLGGEAFGHSISGLLSKLPVEVGGELLDKAQTLNSAMILHEISSI